MNKINFQTIGKMVDNVSYHVGEKLYGVLPADKVVASITNVVDMGGETMAKSSSVVRALAGSIGWAFVKWSKTIDTMVAPTVDPCKPVVPVEYWVSVVGVTFDNRQDVLKSLTGKESVTLKLEAMAGYPNAIGVYANNLKVGHIPDKHADGKTSIAKMLRDKYNQGKDPKIVGWARVGGSVSAPHYGLRVKISNGR